MRVSVIMPAYNMERTVARALQSLIDQTQPVHEVIVVDDGSKDRTAEVIAGFGPPVRLIRQENAGAAAAENRALAAVTGDWVAILDADDWWEPYRLAETVRLHTAHPELNWSSARFTTLWSDGTSTQHPAEAFLPAEAAARGFLVFENYFQASLDGFELATAGMTIRQSLLERAGPFDARLRTAYDLDMWARLAGLDPRVGYTTRPTWVYDRRMEGSLTRQNRSISAQYARLLANHLAPGSRPFTSGRDAHDRWFQRELRRACRHALRFGEKEYLGRYLSDYARWLTPAERAMLRTALLAPTGLLTWAGRVRHRLSARRRFKAGPTPGG